MSERPYFKPGEYERLCREREQFVQRLERNAIVATERATERRTREPINPVTIFMVILAALTVWGMTLGDRGSTSAFDKLNRGEPLTQEEAKEIHNSLHRNSPQYQIR